MYVEQTGARWPVGGRPVACNRFEGTPQAVEDTDSIETWQRISTNTSLGSTEIRRRLLDGLGDWLHARMFVVSL